LIIFIDIYISSLIEAASVIFGFDIIISDDIRYCFSSFAALLIDYLRHCQFDFITTIFI